MRESSVTADAFMFPHFEAEKEGKAKYVLYKLEYLIHLHCKGRWNITEYHIDFLPDARFPCSQECRASSWIRNAVQDTVKELFEKYIIELSRSACAQQYIYSPNPIGRYVSVSTSDSWILSQLKDRFRLRQEEDCIESLTADKYFYTIGFTWGL